MTGKEHRDHRNQKNYRRIGAEEEQRVCRLLEQQGYQVLVCNFRCRIGEIDIVAREGGYLVFIEVKYRSGTGSGLPEEAVDRRKQRVISRVALFYMQRYGYGTDTPVRFDVAAVSGTAEQTLHLYRNAFEYCG